jgi:hypothetical protein
MASTLLQVGVDPSDPPTHDITFKIYKTLYQQASHSGSSPPRHAAL